VRHRARTIRRSWRGFTIVELLIAIGSVAVIAVGLAAIFQTIGRTVSGGQRISVMSQYAATMEKQFRADFDRMTRDGFLVIRQQQTRSRNGQQLAVSLGREDPSPRVRRVDELMFFARGEFESMRTPVNPEVVARAGSAAIYYGMGTRQPESSNEYGTPNWASTNQAGGWLGEANGPNQFASSWTLLRRATLLAKGVNTLQQIPRTGWTTELARYSSFDNQTLADRQCRIALQPAAAHLFRSVARVYWENNAQLYRAGPINWRDAWGGGQLPRLASGYVDIVNAELGDIRNVVEGFDREPSQINTAQDFDRDFGTNGRNGSDPMAGVFDGTIGTITRMHEWMRDALPTNSDMSNANPGSANDPKGVRMRYEEAPPNYLGVLTQNSPATTLILRRSDQVMLTSPAFVPRCTEFIVEWTFGEVASQADQTATGDGLVWYGRSKDDDNDRRLEIVRYENGTYRPFARQTSGGSAAWVLQPRVVYGRTALASETESQTACFGWTDPTYQPSAEDLAAGAPRSLPWAWPRMIRITVGLVDEQNPTVEERFQWVFRLPPDPKP